MYQLLCRNRDITSNIREKGRINWEDLREIHADVKNLFEKRRLAIKFYLIANCFMQSMYGNDKCFPLT